MKPVAYVITLIVLCSFALPKKKYKQSIYGLWECTQYNKHRYTDSGTYGDNFHEVLVCKKDSTGYRLFSKDRYFASHGDTNHNRLILRLPFTFTLEKDDIGNKIKMLFQKGEILESDSTKYRNGYREALKISENAEGFKEVFYWEVVPDTNMFNIKSLQYFEPGKTYKRVFHFKSKDNVF